MSVEIWISVWSGHSIHRDLNMHFLLSTLGSKNAKFRTQRNTNGSCWRPNHYGRLRCWFFEQRNHCFHDYRMWARRKSLQKQWDHWQRYWKEVSRNTFKSSMNDAKSVSLPKELLWRKCCVNRCDVTYFCVINQFWECFEATYTLSDYRK
jgi:hypothetical protein